MDAELMQIFRYKTTGSYCVENRKTRIKSHHFVSHARNVCLQHHHTYADATSPTARSTNDVIQTVHSFLMRRLSSTSSTSEILRAGGGHFEHVV